MGTALPIKMEVTDMQGRAITPGIVGFRKIGM
jgi:imidazolonepropionase-like amidohydrolase